MRDAVDSHLNGLAHGSIPRSKVEPDYVEVKEVNLIAEKEGHLCEWALFRARHNGI